MKTITISIITLFLFFGIELYSQVKFAPIINPNYAATHYSPINNTDSDLTKKLNKEISGRISLSIGMAIRFNLFKKTSFTYGFSYVNFYRHNKTINPSIVDDQKKKLAHRIREHGIEMPIILHQVLNKGNINKHSLNFGVSIRHLRSMVIKTYTNEDGLIIYRHELSELPTYKRIFQFPIHLGYRYTINLKGNTELDIGPNIVYQSNIFERNNPGNWIRHSILLGISASFWIW